MQRIKELNGTEWGIITLFTLAIIMLILSVNVHY